MGTLEANRRFHVRHPDFKKKAYRRYLAKKPWQYQLYGVKARAKRYGLACDLDDAWFEARWDGVCAISGLPFTKVEATRSIRGQSVDRIDNAQGYLKTNCRLVLHCVNLLKFTGTDAEMLEVARSIVSNAL